MMSLSVVAFCMSRIGVVLPGLYDIVCLFMCLCYGVYLSFVYRVHKCVLCVLFKYFLVCALLFAFGVCVLFVV